MIEIFHFIDTMKKVCFLFLLSIIFLANTGYTQVMGCTDPNSNNYNPSATQNDGSCTYNMTIYNPPIKYLLPDEIEESSGLAYHNGRLWTINDSGGLPKLYAFDTVTGEIIQRITVFGAQNTDWEALADDDVYIYIGDFGNNAGTRDDLKVFRLKKADIPDDGDANVNSDIINFSYSDYSSDDVKSKNHNFDCEALIATDEWLYLFSKNRGNQKSKLYQLPKNPGDYTAQLINTFNTSGLITGADINLEKNEVTLIGYVDQSWVPFAWLLFDYEGDGFFSGNKRRIDMPNIVASQTEAIVYTIGRNEIVTSEGHILFSQSAYDFNSGKWTENSPSGMEDVQAGQFDFVLSPNPVKKSKITVEILRLPIGEYELAIYNSMGKLVDSNKYTLSRKSGNTKIKIKVGKYPAGYYFVRLSSGNQVVEKKFIKN